MMATTAEGVTASLRVFMAGALVFLTLSWFGPAFGADPVRQAVERGNRAFLAAYVAHDAAKLASIYSPDAAVLPPGDERANGRAAIQKFWQGAMDAGITNVSLRTLELKSAGNLAYEIGEYSLAIPDNAGKLTPTSGKYVVVWKRAGNGVWQIHRDVWNDTPSR